VQGLLIVIRKRGLLGLTGNKLKAGFSVRSYGLLEFDASLGNKFSEFDKVGRKELEAAVRKVDVHHTARTNRHGPKILGACKKCLIVQ